MANEQSNTGEWYCPLINNKISEGECLDVNYERLGYVKGCSLEKMKKTIGKSTEEISFVCEHCSNMPLR